MSVIFLFKYFCNNLQIRFSLSMGLVASRESQLCYEQNFHSVALKVKKATEEFI